MQERDVAQGQALVNEQMYQEQIRQKKELVEDLEEEVSYLKNKIKE